MAEQRNSTHQPLALHTTLSHICEETERSQIYWRPYEMFQKELRTEGISDSAVQKRKWTEVLFGVMAILSATEGLSPNLARGASEIQAWLRPACTNYVRPNPVSVRCYPTWRAIDSIRR